MISSHGSRLGSESPGLAKIWQVKRLSVGAPGCATPTPGSTVAWVGQHEKRPRAPGPGRPPWSAAGSGSGPTTVVILGPEFQVFAKSVSRGLFHIGDCEAPPDSRDSVAGGGWGSCQAGPQSPAGGRVPPAWARATDPGPAGLGTVYPSHVKACRDHHVSKSRCYSLATYDPK
jgi:hypothetical protein